jgi:hypothetical protein
MVIKSIAFSGRLDKSNSITVSIDETYIPIRYGTWQIRVDSLSVTLPKSEYYFSAHLALSCSLLQAPIVENHYNQESSSSFELKERRVQGNPPLHIFTIDSLPDRRLQLLSPGQGAWFQFQRGVTKFDLHFSNVEFPNKGEGVPKLGIGVVGVLHFQCIPIPIRNL